MGDEIQQRHFEADDFSIFRSRLDEETEHLSHLFSSNELSRRGNIIGFELEVCLIDEKGHPSLSNDLLLKELDNPLVVPELAKFNVEINTSPVQLTGYAFSHVHDELESTWNACVNAGSNIGIGVVPIGILPTITPDLLDSKHMSEMMRYRALNDRTLALRDGKPIQIEIENTDRLEMTHPDVMLEAATTSFQVHIQCRPNLAVREFNAMLMASAPMVALSANSPFLFGKSLWHETRIPLFEQSVDVGDRYLPRVSFGTDYVHESVFEVFEENANKHILLLPYVQSEPMMKYAHLRFQNGTIWRWNRPLIGFDFDGQPHLRIEHRAIPAGPTLQDAIANSVALIGITLYLSELETPLESILPFEAAKINFYEAAKYGLDANIYWPGIGSTSIKKLLLEELLPNASAHLLKEGIPDNEVHLYLDQVVARVESGQTGAQWQLDWMKKNGPNFEQLVLEYMAHQQTNRPIHTWPSS